MLQTSKTCYPFTVLPRTAHRAQQRRSKWWRVVWIVLLVVMFLLVVLTTAGSFFMYNLVLNPHSSKASLANEEQAVIPVPQVDQDWFAEDRDGKYSTYATSFDGLRLHRYGFVHALPSLSGVWVVVVHGYLADSTKMASYVRQFYENFHCNVIAPDLRGHGQSEGSYVGMGWHDRLDVLQIVHDITSQHPQARVVLFGVSMGGATVTNTSGEPLPPTVRAVISDCAYSSVYELFAYQLRQAFRLPRFPLLYTVDWINQSKNHYRLADVDVTRQTRQSVTPVLFIHGQEDTFVPTSMMETLYNANRSPVKLKLVVQHAGHARSELTDPELYWTTVRNFLQECGCL